MKDSNTSLHLFIVRTLSQAILIALAEAKAAERKAARAASGRLPCLGTTST